MSARDGESRYIVPAAFDATALAPAASAAKRRSLAPASTAEGVYINGLRKPVSVTWSDDGMVFIAEKAGVVKALAGWVGSVTDVRPTLDLTASISSFGDHGLSCILWDRDEGGTAWLYVTYMQNDWGPTGCSDSGQLDGRPNAQIDGCAIFGKFSRFPLNDAGAVVGAEEPLLDTRKTSIGAACVQFSTHSAPAAVAKVGGVFHLSFGDGAGFYTFDLGLGDNPCGDAPGYMGAYRSQNPGVLNGKIVALSEASGWAPTVLTRGHRNAFRLAGVGGHLLATETGWYTYEEINVIEAGQNKGWPCFEGPARTPEYKDLPGGEAACPPLLLPGAHSGPAGYYEHPKVVAPLVCAISCIAGDAATGTVYFGDYVLGWVKQVPLAALLAGGVDLLNDAAVTTVCAPSGARATPLLPPFTPPPPLSSFLPQR